MIRTYLIPLLAIAGLVFALVTVVKGSKPRTAQPPVIPPPTAPFEAFVAGAGLVETNTQNIAVGSPVGALVEQVLVTVGTDVEAGQELFRLDTRELGSQRLERLAAQAVADQQVRRLEAGTRPEQLPPQRARVAEADADIAAAKSEEAEAGVWLQDAQAQLQRATGMTTPGAMSQEELDKRRATVMSSQARLAAAQAKVAQATAMRSEAQAQLDLLQAGTWGLDLEVARAQALATKAAVDSLDIEIARRTVRSPVTGRVLQVNVRPGEFAQAGPLATPLMIVGGVKPLHIRVDVDEHEAWRVTQGAPGEAYARGNRDIRTKLEFVRFEPYIVPKKSLTGESTERVDTRVLQVIYRFDPAGVPLYVGQQVDVFIQAEKMPPATGAAKESAK